MDVKEKRLIFKKKNEKSEIIIFISLEDKPLDLKETYLDLISGKNIRIVQKGIYYLQKV